MPKRDSVDKIVTAYFAAVNAEPFDYKGKHYPVKTLTVSPLILRGFTCPPMCGGCCPTFSLDYLPAETSPRGYALQGRTVEFNGWHIPLLSDLQDERTEHHCKHLNMTDGRCGIHGWQPFSCDFELIRFMHADDTAHAATRLFGRGWFMLRVDGERGARCTITPPTLKTMADTVRKLKRLAQWCDHFQLPHRIAPILQWVETHPSRALVLPAPTSGFF